MEDSNSDFELLGNDFPSQIWLELLIDKCIDFVWKTLRGRRNGKSFSIKSSFVKVAKVSRLCTVPQYFVSESTSKEKLLNYTSNITVQQNMNVYCWLFKLIKKNKKHWEILIVFYWWIIKCQLEQETRKTVLEHNRISSTCWFIFFASLRNIKTNELFSDNITMKSKFKRTKHLNSEHHDILHVKLTKRQKNLTLLKRF